MAKGIAGPQLLAVSVEDLDEGAQWYAATFQLEPLADRPSPDGALHTRVLGSSSLVVELSHHRAARSVADYAGAPVPTYLVHGFFKAGFIVTDEAALLDTSPPRP